MKYLCLCLMVFLAVVGAWGQDEAVTLRYKFTPGETSRYEITGTGTMPLNIDLTPAGQGMMAMDQNLDIKIATEQLCRAIDDQGVADVEMKMPVLVIHTSMKTNEQPVETEVKWEEGKLTTTVNGQAQPEDENTRKLLEVLSTAFKLKMKPNGETTPDPETLALMAKLQGAGVFGGMDMNRMNALTTRLPEGPAKVGDTWKTEEEMKMGEAVLKGASSFKLAALEDFEGVRCARIEGDTTLTADGTITVGGGPGGQQNSITRMEIAMTFVSYLDPETGHVLNTKAEMTQNMAMMINTGQKTAEGKPIILSATLDNGVMTVEQRRK